MCNKAQREAVNFYFKELVCKEDMYLAPPRPFKDQISRKTNLRSRVVAPLPPLRTKNMAFGVPPTPFCRPNPWSIIRPLHTNEREKTGTEWPDQKFDPHIQRICLITKIITFCIQGCFSLLSPKMRLPSALLLRAAIVLTAVCQTTFFQMQINQVQNRRLWRAVFTIHFLFCNLFIFFQSASGGADNLA